MQHAPPDLLAALHEALQANLLVDAALRQAGELRVQQLRSQPGFAACLVRLTLDPSGSVEVRRLLQQNYTNPSPSPSPSPDPEPDH